MTGGHSTRTTGSSVFDGGGIRSTDVPTLAIDNQSGIQDAISVTQAATVLLLCEQTPRRSIFRTSHAGTLQL